MTDSWKGLIAGAVSDARFRAPAQDETFTEVQTRVPRAA